MTSINNLTSQGTVTGSDQFPVYSNGNGDTRRVSGQAIKEFVEADFVPAGGILNISGFYSMRKTPVSPVTLAIGTGYTNIPNYDAPVQVFPSDRTSIVGMTTIGEFVATRDIAAAMFWVALTGSWPTTRDLTVAVLVGTDTSPFESGSKFIGSGRGGGLLATANFSAPVVNQNNPFGTIRAGEKIRLVAKMSVADNLDLTRLAFVVQTLDGI
jgi:hypothetical protein